MKKIYFLFEKTLSANKVLMLFMVLSCLFLTKTSAQIGVTVTNNTNTTPNLATSYTSLATALTDLNLVSAMSGPITLTLAAGTETAPVAGFEIGSATLNSVLSATNTITVIGAGATTVINAGVGIATPASAIPDGMLKLVGADYVTIDGLTFTDGNTTNPATMEFGLAMFKASATDGCQNNTVQNCVFNMQSINFAVGAGPMVQGSVGVLLVNSLPTTATTVVTVTAASGSNSNNKIYSNTTNGGNYGIVLSGFAAATPFTLADTNNDVGGNSALTGNSTLNYGGGAVATSPSAGIRSIDQWGFNLSYNTINNNNGSGVNHVNTLRGIITSGSTSASGNINNNNITVSGGGTTSQLDGISNSAGGTAASNTININNNTLVLNYATATNATINGIVNASSAATLNINGNNVSAGSVIPGTGSHVLISGGSPVVLNINNNVVGNYTRSSTAGGASRGIVIASPTTTTINNNIISNLAYTNAASTGTIDGVYGFSSSVDVTISNNQVNNLTTAGGAIRGIVEFGVAGNKNVFSNTVHTFAKTAGYAGTGVTYTGITCSTGVTNIYRNKIYNLTSTGTTGANSVGISMTGGTTSTISNNIIGQLYTPTSTGFNSVRGIDVSGGTTVNVYHNTVRLDATSTSVTTFGTSCFYFNTTPTSVDVRNNIFVNASTPAQNGTNSFANGVSAGIRRSTGTTGTVPANYVATSNNNLIYVDAAAGTNNHLTYAEAQSAAILNPINTLAAFKAFMVNRDQLSVDENPTFVSIVGSDATYLHIDTAVATFVESGAASIGSITNDFDGDIRQGVGGYVGTGFAPDMGADEFEGIPNTPACSGTPAASATNGPASVCTGTNFSLTLGTAYSFTGITYQWQSSPDGVAAYTNIGGATLSSYTASQTASTFYQCIITCVNGGATTTSTPVQVNMNSVYACYCASTYANGAGTTDGVTNVTLLTLNNTSTQNNVAPYYTLYNAVTVPDLPQNSNQSISITFGSDANQFGGVWIDWNQDGDLNDVGEFVANNTVTPGANGTIVLNIAVPAGATLGNTLMRVRGGNDTALTNTPCGASSSIYGETEDYIVNIVTNPICAGAPVASNTTAPASVCSGTNFNLGLSVVQFGTGYTYQWQSSPDGIAAYADIVGQTATTASVSQTASTFYQCVITCTGSGLTTISTPVQVNMNSIYTCYCASTYGSGTGATGGDAITNVTLGTLNNSSNGGATPTASPYYTFYNAVTIPDLTQGSGQTISISFGTDGAQFSGVWIDYNQDGDLLDAGEFVANSTVTAGVSGTSNLNFTVPVGASLGNTLMRIRGGNDSVLTNTPCGASSSVWGETEDYIINITPCVTPSISTQPITPISVCENTAVNLSVTATGTGLTYQWKKDTVDIALATSATYSIPSALVADSGSYTVLITGACGTVLSDASIVTVTANSTLPNEVVSVCDTYTWAANGTTYTTSGTYTSVTNCVTRTLDLTITPSSSLPTEVVSACDTYTWSANGATYTTSGIYTSTTACVTRTLDLTITPSSSLPTEVVSVCDTYTWTANGTTYTTSGIYTSTTACVTRTLDLTITPSSSLPTEVVSACDTYTWSANGTTYTTSGIYTNVVNCVTRTLDLTINLSTTTTTNVTVCDSYTWAENGTTYTVSGTYTNVTTNGAGCPNTATLNLIVTNASIDFANLQFPASAAICEGGTMTAYGQVYEPGFTEAAGQAAGIDVEFGYNSANTNPNTWSTWTPATFNVQVGNNDEYMFTTSNALVGGTYYYTFRYRLSGCSTWQYGGDNNGFWNGTTQNSGVLTITAATISGATTQVINGGVAADVTIEDIVVTSNGTVTWFASSADAASNINPLAVGTQLVDGNTYYGVTNIGACRSTTLAVTVTVVLGNTSFDLSQLNYYPNPVKDIFNVKYNKEIISVDVYDLTGRKVIEMKPNTLEVQLNMTNLSNAMYIVRLQSVDGITELKVYKN